MNSFSADGFINGLAAVTSDCLELSSSDVYILAVVYEPKSGSRRGKGGKKGKGSKDDLSSKTHIAARLVESKENAKFANADPVVYAEAWKGGERAFKLKRLRAAFDNKDTDNSGYLDYEEIASALAQSGVIASEVSYNDKIVHLPVMIFKELIAKSTIRLFRTH